MVWCKEVKVQCKCIMSVLIVVVEYLKCFTVSDSRSDHKEVSDHSADSQQSGYSQRECLSSIRCSLCQRGFKRNWKKPYLWNENNGTLLPQLEVGSFQARVPSAPAAARLSSAALRVTPPAPTVSATPAWGATEPPRTPATTPTAPPAQVRPH